MSSFKLKKLKKAKKVPLLEEEDTRPVFKLKKINNMKVKKVPLLEEEDTRPVKGSDLLPGIYSNVFLCARTKSGKTSCIYKIIKECAGRDTKIVVFVSTLYKDSSWKTIREYCRQKGLSFEGHMSIRDDDGVDILAQLVRELQQNAKEEEEDKALNQRVAALERKLKMKCPIQTDFDDSDDDEDRPKKKEKYRSPEYIIVLDDLSDELKSKSLYTLIKKNRHFKSKILVSSQYLNDLFPQSRKQIDTWMVFGGQPKKKLDDIYSNANLSMDIEEFYDIYRFATEKPYSFLYLNGRENDFRRCFDYRIITE